MYRRIAGLRSYYWIYTALLHTNTHVCVPGMEFQDTHVDRLVRGSAGRELKIKNPNYLVKWRLINYGRLAPATIVYYISTVLVVEYIVSRHSAPGFDRKTNSLKRKLQNHKS